MSDRQNIEENKKSSSFDEEGGDLSEFSHRSQNLQSENFRKILKQRENLTIIIALISSTTLVLLLLATFNKPQSPPPTRNISLQLNMDRQLKAHPLNMHHKHQQEDWIQPTLGRPTKQTVFNYTKVEAKDYYEFEKRMDSLVRPYNDTDCQYARYGHQSGDGGYLVCQNVIPGSNALINVGIKAFDEFGCQFSAAYNALNYQFDCTDQVGYRCTGILKSYPNLVCLSDRSEWTPKYVYSSLKDMVDGNGLTEKRISLKLDAQGSEWDGLKTFPISYIDNVDQIFMKIHLSPEATGHNRRWGDLDILSKLQERFVSVNFNQNNAACYSSIGQEKKHYFSSSEIEITLVNKKYIKIKNPSRSYKKHLLNKVNFDSITSRCQMQN